MVFSEYFDFLINNLKVVSDEYNVSLSSKLISAPTVSPTSINSSDGFAFRNLVLRYDAY